MFINRQNDAKLDTEITSALDELETLRDDPQKYASTIDRITRLQTLKSERGLKPPSMDTVLIVGANLFGILWLARYEREHIIRAQNALRFVMKPRTSASA